MKVRLPTVNLLHLKSERQSGLSNGADSACPDATTPPLEISDTLLRAARKDQAKELLIKGGKVITAGALAGALGYGLGKLLVPDLLYGAASWAAAGLGALAAATAVGLQDTGSVEQLIESRNFEREEQTQDWTSRRHHLDFGQALKEARQQVQRRHLGFKPWNRETVAQIRQDTRKVLRARYLQASGVNVPGAWSHEQLSEVRDYVREEGSKWNLEDAGRAIEQAWNSGQGEIPALLRAAEEELYRERGVGQLGELAHYSTEELRELRTFSDRWTPSRFRNSVQLGVEKTQPLVQLLEHIPRQELTALGYQLPEELDARTTLSLLKACAPEDVRANRWRRDGINQALAEGKRNFYELAHAANLKVLCELGLNPDELEVEDEAIQAVKPFYRNLPGLRADLSNDARELLWVLPSKERKEALKSLREGQTNWTNFVENFEAWLDQGLEARLGESESWESWDAMRKANYVSSLARFPKALDSEVFQQPPEKGRKNLIRKIEREFGVRVHDRAGQGPQGGDDTTIAKWPMQGLVALYNALNLQKGPDGLPSELQKTKFAFSAGTDENATDLWGGRGRYDRGTTYSLPGKIWERGTSRYGGLAYQDTKGYDIIELGDCSLMGSGACALGLSKAENNLIHECAHAHQLGGEPGKSYEIRELQTQKQVLEWSSIAGWRDADGQVASGQLDEQSNYGDPALRLLKPQETVTDYAAWDPVEDYAEYVVRYYADPEIAQEVSKEKFSYCNQHYGIYSEAF